MSSIFAANTGTRNPMVYDVMREVATRLRGEYVAREDAATDEADKVKWREARYRLVDELYEIDPRDQDLVRAKTDEYVAARKALPPLDL